MNPLDKRKLKIYERDVLKSDFNVDAAIAISLKRCFPEFDRIEMKDCKSETEDFYYLIMEDCRDCFEKEQEDFYCISLAKKAKEDLTSLFKIAERKGSKVESFFPFTYEFGIRKPTEEEANEQQL